MHLRKRQLGATQVFAFFLYRAFWCQKHHFKPKYGTKLFARRRSEKVAPEGQQAR
jgi:hypothetical protein